MASKQLAVEFHEADLADGGEDLALGDFVGLRRHVQQFAAGAYGAGRNQDEGNSSGFEFGDLVNEMTYVGNV
jgi:hypothetical protein